MLDTGRVLGYLSFNHQVALLKGELIDCNTSFIIIFFDPSDTPFQFPSS